MNSAQKQTLNVAQQIVNDHLNSPEAKVLEMLEIVARGFEVAKFINQKAHMVEFFFADNSAVQVQLKAARVYVGHRPVGTTSFEHASTEIHSTERKTVSMRAVTC